MSNCNCISRNRSIGSSRTGTTNNNCKKQQQQQQQQQPQPLQQQQKHEKQQQQQQQKAAAATDIPQSGNVESPPKATQTTAHNHHKESTHSQLWVVYVFRLVLAWLLELNWAGEPPQIDLVDRADLSEIRFQRSDHRKQGPWLQNSRPCDCGFEHWC